jgi:hypothetical protein
MFQYKFDVIFFSVLDNLPKNGSSASCIKYWMYEIHLVGAKSMSSHEENNFNFFFSIFTYVMYQHLVPNSCFKVYQIFECLVPNSCFHGTLYSNAWYRIYVFMVPYIRTLGTELIVFKVSSL